MGEEKKVEVEEEKKVEVGEEKRVEVWEVLDSGFRCTHGFVCTHPRTEAHETNQLQCGSQRLMTSVGQH